MATATYSLMGALVPGTVAAGGAHSLVAIPDGRVFAFGHNGFGQIGDGSTTHRNTPRVVHPLTGITTVAAGQAHSLALTTDGRLYGWGHNGYGQIGDGQGQSPLRPWLIPNLTNVVAVAAGYFHTLALRSDGTVVGFGLNSSGQLGLGAAVSYTSTPTAIPGLTDIVAIGAGDDHSLAVTASGQLYAFGANGFGQLGDGTPTTRYTPVLINLANVASVAAGTTHSLALLRDGSVYSWGGGQYGQLGRGGTPSSEMTPTMIPGLYASAIGAGDHHSAAVRFDGVLVAWGASNAGQIGDTSTTQRTSPVVVSGPGSVSSIAFADTHSLAASPEGDIWSWGGGGWGQLGDNGWSNRPTPQAILTGVWNWQPAAPMLSAPSTLLLEPTTMTVQSSTSGATIRYTTDGAEPTESDSEVPPSGQVSLSAPSQFRAKAFATGRQPGRMARAEYTAPSAAPTITPESGVYSSAQSVTITAAAGPPSTVRYTLDGSTPTTSSTAYSAPFNVNTGMTIKARSFPNDGSAGSAIATSTLNFNYGTLAAPTASPDAGVYADAQTVTLSSIAGATIRYTLDGSEPTAVSNVYVTPLSVGSGSVTIKARAFHPDWEQSSVASHDYAIDTVTPSITSSRFPAAVGGWHNTATTISFTCNDNIGIASCSSSITISIEGAGQEIVGTAIDQGGRQATDTAIVNLDSTAPSVVITTPAASLTTSNASVDLVGEVADTLSGIASATCNGQSATIVSGSVSCTVPVGPGRNDLILAARDVAGNVTSKSVRVIRIGTATAIGLSPSARTLLVDETTTLKLTDDFGSVVTAASWSSSDPAIVSVSTDDPPVLTALQAGSVTIAATKNGLSAQAELNVVAGTTLSYGTARWSIAGAPGYSVWTSIVANRVELSVPDLFSVERAGATTIVRGITGSGDVLWTQQAPSEPLMGDSFGGLVGATFAGSNVPGMDAAEYGAHYTAYDRFAGPDGVAAWRYEPTFVLSRPAQAPDGTIYAIERYPTGANNPNGLPIFETQIVVLDGTNGAVRARYPLAHEQRRGLNCAEVWLASPNTLGPVVGTDGYGYVAVRRWTDVNPCSNNLAQHVGVDLLRISPTGSVTTTEIYSQQCTFGLDPGRCDRAPLLRQLVPDGVGGTLVRALYALANNLPMETRLIRIHDGVVQFSNVVDDDERITMIGDAGTAFLSGDDVRAVDVTNWTPRWVNASTTLEPVTAMPNGKAAMYDLSTGQLIEITETGAQGASASFAGSRGYQSALGLWTGVSTGSAPALTARFSLPVNEAASSFKFLGGQGTNQNAITERRFTTRELAAIFALEHIYPASRNNNWEYGGLVCQSGNRFIWSEFVTDENQDEVIIPNGLCYSNLMAARFHTHPPKERPLPSGGDYGKADENGIRGIPNYLMAPTAWNAHPDPDEPSFSSPSWFLKYWFTPPNTSSDQNLCLWIGGTTWIPFYSGAGANCSTPTP